MPSRWCTGTPPSYRTIISHKNDPKKYWESINRLLPSNRSNKRIWLINHDTNELISDVNIANFINSYFVNIGPKLAESFCNPWVSQGTDVPWVMNDVKTDVPEVCKLINAIDICKSSAMENLSSRVLNDAFQAIPEIITSCFNLSLETGIFPWQWKLAKVVPFTGDVSNDNNYRPVSLLPLPGKLLEKIVHKHLLNYLETYDLLNAAQGGFRPGHSTTDTIARFTDDVLLKANDSQCTLATFIDLRKAFDTVDHSILSHKLISLGIKNVTLEWIKSYLSDRGQCTLANGYLSSNLPVVCGVPQGSILGPLIF